MYLTRRIFPLGLAAFLSCSSPQGGGDGGSLMPEAGQLGLRVNQASLLKLRNGTDGPWTQTQVYVSVTLANGAGRRMSPQALRSSR